MPPPRAHSGRLWGPNVPLEEALAVPLGLFGRARAGRGGSESPGHPSGPGAAELGEQLRLFLGPFGGPFGALYWQFGACVLGSLLGPPKNMTSGRTGKEKE